MITVSFWPVAIAVFLAGVITTIGVARAIDRRDSHRADAQATADLLTLHCRRCNQRRRVPCTCQEDCRQPGCSPDGRRFTKADAQFINSISEHLEAVARGETSA
jgi:hypothetical protein